MGFAAILMVSIANAFWWMSLAGFAAALSVELLMAFVSTRFGEDQSAFTR